MVNNQMADIVPLTKRIVFQDIDKPVNRELLYEELQTALGNILVGVKPLSAGTRIVLLAPSAADITTATQIVLAHDADMLTDTQQTFDQIKTLILGAVGKSVLDLTDAERWALLAGLLYQGRAVAPDMTIRHPQWWIARQDAEDE